MFEGEGWDPRTNRARIRDGKGRTGRDGDGDGGRGWPGWIGLTEATRPVAETARLDCRRAFLNIVKGEGSEDGRMEFSEGEM